eukprot:TRINITY_DN1234_c0_g4_i2.p2 TRINITY_DN1234_c0_g4~~TRINITY_DN1234_c0_g4_i2.p2  ORF type:complete len:147 (-),score=13.22 TRINITY_DN1234_c0_g4_i2:71-511(-)
MSTEGNCCVFVGNLAYSVNDAALQEHMSQAGEVVSAIVLRMGSRSKGCGLVEYASAEDAENAQKTLTETELEGRNIFVREVCPEQPRDHFHPISPPPRHSALFKKFLLFLFLRFFFFPHKPGNGGDKSSDWHPFPGFHCTTPRPNG